MNQELRTAIEDCIRHEIDAYAGGEIPPQDLIAAVQKGGFADMDVREALLGLMASDVVELTTASRLRRRPEAGKSKRVRPGVDPGNDAVRDAARDFDRQMQVRVAEILEWLARGLQDGSIKLDFQAEPFADKRNRPKAVRRVIEKMDSMTYIND